MTDWKAIADGLARVLRSRPCNCERPRAADGRIRSYEEISKVCSRCTELEKYDAAVAP